MISPRATIADLSEYLKSPGNLLSVDYSSIWSGDVRVICLADKHVPQAFKDEYIRALPQLRQLGLTHLAFELLSVDQQTLLDEYLAGGAHDTSIRAKLVDHFNHVWGGDADDDGGVLRMAEKLTSMVDAAIERGVQVVAMEPPLPHPFREGDGYSLVHQGLELLPESLQESFDAFFNPASSDSVVSVCAARIEEQLLAMPPADSKWDAESASRFMHYLHIMRTADPAPLMQGLPMPRPRECYAEALLDPQWGDIVDKWRDAHWQSALHNALDQTDSRIAVFAGCGHFGYETETSNINEHLAHAGYSSVVIGFAGGDFYLEPQPEDALDVRLMSAASELGLQKQTFAVPVARQSPRDCDWIVHIGVFSTSDP